ncbi:CBS domain-containing protein [Thermococcus sp. Bubb.Bath]|uniref:CBS domain-containing protein n=1 Tax=Thermococcus sp. Bubb.Bath TaxID=1638242 RepID=UPI0014398B03|nr:CBS domain-containing protein [Thermococcus sp. Bubb.Bath]NJF25432.1 CBS domain-containing protein [Thermococcus sp. Bubb.Bath]
MDRESALEKFHAIRLMDIAPDLKTIPMVESNTDILDVLKILRTRHHVWVVENRKTMRLVGIIRYLDVIDILLPPEAHRFKLGMTSRIMKSLLGGATTAGDVAEKQPLAIEDTETVLDALMKMRKYKTQVLAVVEGDKLVGEVSLRILIDELLRLMRVGGAQWIQ